MRKGVAAALLAAGLLVVAAPHALAHCTFFLDRDRVAPGGEFFAFGNITMGHLVEIRWGSQGGPVLDTFVVSEPAPSERYPDMGSYRRRLAVPDGEPPDQYWVVAIVDPNHAKAATEALEPRYSFTRLLHVVAGTDHAGGPAHVRAAQPPGGHVHEPVRQPAPARQPAVQTSAAPARGPATVRSPAVVRSAAQEAAMSPAGRAARDPVAVPDANAARAARQNPVGDHPAEVARRAPLPAGLRRALSVLGAAWPAQLLLTAAASLLWLARSVRLPRFVH